MSEDFFSVPELFSFSRTCEAGCLDTDVLLNDLSVDKGAYITADLNQAAVVPDSPAAEAGIKKNDIILKIGDQEINEDRSLASILRTHRPGDEVTIVWLSGEEEKSAQVVLDKFE